MIEKLRSRWRGAILVAVALAAPGCGRTPPQPVDAGQKAESALDEALGAWVNGESPEQFTRAHPRLTASDPDWQAGWRLLSYLCAETTPGPDGSASFRCRVSLSLRDRQGRLLDREAVYDVRLSPECVITRAAP